MITCILLHMVRRRYPQRPAHTSPHETYAPGIGIVRVWTCRYWNKGTWQQVRGRTEAGALRAALRAGRER